MMSQEIRELLYSQEMRVFQGHFALMSGQEAEDFLAWVIECVGRYHGEERVARAMRPVLV